VTKRTGGWNSPILESVRILFVVQGADGSSYIDNTYGSTWTAIRYIYLKLVDSVRI
jgi:hypothetical protein